MLWKSDRWTWILILKLGNYETFKKLLAFDSSAVQIRMVTIYRKVGRGRMGIRQGELEDMDCKSPPLSQDIHRTGQPHGGDLHEKNPHYWEKFTRDQ